MNISIVACTAGMHSVYSRTLLTRAQQLLGWLVMAKNILKLQTINSEPRIF